MSLRNIEWQRYRDDTGNVEYTTDGNGGMVFYIDSTLILHTVAQTENCDPLLLLLAKATREALDEGELKMIETMIEANTGEQLESLFEEVDE